MDNKAKKSERDVVDFSRATSNAFRAAHASVVSRFRWARVGVGSAQIAASLAVSSFTVFLVLLMAAPASGSVYRCDTPRGPIFSQTPCAEDAKEVDLRVYRPANGTAPESAHDRTGLDDSIDEQADDRVPDESTRLVPDVDLDDEIDVDID